MVQIYSVKMGQIKSAEKTLEVGILSLNMVTFLRFNLARLCQAPCDCWEATMTATNGLQER